VPLVRFSMYQIARVANSAASVRLVSPDVLRN
jgi:hypothetical protein